MFFRKAASRYACFTARRFWLCAAFTALLLVFGVQGGHSSGSPCGAMVVRIYDWKNGTLHAEAPVAANSRLFFGWIHSLEKIPWNEYYKIDASYRLVLDAISFPAFGAGIPADRGTVCYVKDGLIHMEGIAQVFPELVWLNSHTATRDIVLDGQLLVSGAQLPQHTRMRLLIEKR